VNTSVAGSQAAPTRKWETVRGSKSGGGWPPRINDLCPVRSRWPPTECNHGQPLANLATIKSMLTNYDHLRDNYVGKPLTVRQMNMHRAHRGEICSMTESSVRPARHPVAATDERRHQISTNTLMSICSSKRGRQRLDPSTMTIGWLESESSPTSACACESRNRNSTGRPRLGFLR